MSQPTQDPAPIVRTPGPPMVGHSADTLPVDGYWRFVTRYGKQPQRIERTGGAVLVGPVPGGRLGQ